MITGRVFALDGAKVTVAGGATRFRSLPVWDAPVLVAERAGLELVRETATASASR